MNDAPGTEHAASQNKPWVVFLYVEAATASLRGLRKAGDLSDPIVIESMESTDVIIYHKATTQDTTLTLDEISLRKQKKTEDKKFKVKLKLCFLDRHYY